MKKLYNNKPSPVPLPFTPVTKERRQELWTGLKDDKAKELPLPPSARVRHTELQENQALLKVIQIQLI